MTHMYDSLEFIRENYSNQEFTYYDLLQDGLQLITSQDQEKAIPKAMHQLVCSGYIKRVGHSWEREGWGNPMNVYRLVDDDPCRFDTPTVIESLISEQEAEHEETSLVELAQQFEVRKKQFDLIRQDWEDAKSLLEECARIKDAHEKELKVLESKITEMVQL